MQTIMLIGVSISVSLDHFIQIDIEYTCLIESTPISHKRHCLEGQGVAIGLHQTHST
jgi:hypothetical protein